MNTTKIIILIVVALALVGGFFVFKSGNEATAPTTSEPNITVEGNGTSGASISIDGIETEPVDASPAGPPGFTLAEIATHNSKADCWSAVNGKVYDLTNWIDAHPGGSSNILNICGVDGSAGFNGKHGGEAKPASTIVTFEIGVLK